MMKKTQTSPPIVRKICRSLDENAKNLILAKDILRRCNDVSREFDSRFFASNEECNAYLHYVDNLLDDAIRLLKKIID